MRSLTWYVDVPTAASASVVHTLREQLAAAGWHDAGNVPIDASFDASFDAVADPVPGSDATVVWSERALPEALVNRLLASRSAVLVAGPTLSRADPERRWAEAAGVWPGELAPRHDVRVRPGPDAPLGAQQITDHAHQGSAHLGEHVHVAHRLLAVEKTAADVEVLFAAMLGLARQPVATFRRSTGVATWTLGADGDVDVSRAVLRLLLLTLARAVGAPEPPQVRVGLLGYGAIGPEHVRALTAVEGLAFEAVADLSEHRRAAARMVAPGVRAYADASSLLDDDGVDVVVVSTPPSTHAPLALRALESGKHVVVEKPFAIHTADADEVLAAARSAGRLAVVYQNRRFDPDYLAIARLVGEGAVGEVFHVESFVGGFGHPCNLWHSDDATSGGAFYDWGAHVVDQLLDLVPSEVDYVTATTHKRRWHDVTNADHARVTVAFASGAEAEFVYSDLAAALKPRWYVLGTDGAIVGHWRSERVVARSDIGTLVEDPLAPADSPPELALHSPDGSVTQLATPPAPPYPFHSELADRLRLGLPMSVTGEQSRRVLGVLEAARASAAAGGRPVAPR